jgi:hypothetical protein
MKSPTMTAQEAIEAIGALKSLEEISSSLEDEASKTAINASGFSEEVKVFPRK